MTDSMKEFLGKLHDLMVEYDIEMEVEENSDGYNSYIEGLTFDQKWLYEGSEIVRQGSSHTVHGRYINANDVKESV